MTIDSITQRPLPRRTLRPGTPADAQVVKTQGKVDRLTRPNLSGYHQDGFSPASSATKYLDPMHNYRATKDGSTYCNFFTQDYLKLRGVKNFPQMNANDTNQWLNSRQGANAGWRQVSGQQAEDFVDQGGVGLVSSPNPHGHGHIAPIIEGQTVNGEPQIANAGSQNFAAGPDTASPAFRRPNTQFFIYDPQRN